MYVCRFVHFTLCNLHARAFVVGIKLQENMQHKREMRTVRKGMERKKFHTRILARHLYYIRLRVQTCTHKHTHGAGYCLQHLTLQHLSCHSFITNISLHFTFSQSAFAITRILFLNAVKAHTEFLYLSIHTRTHTHTHSAVARSSNKNPVDRSKRRYTATNNNSNSQQQLPTKCRPTGAIATTTTIENSRRKAGKCTPSGDLQTRTDPLLHTSNTHSHIHARIY